jgi:uncharacterized protein (DUF4415 family)
MTQKKKLMTTFEPGKGFTRHDWDAVSDNPEWTKSEMSKSKSFAEAFPELDASIKRSRGRPALEKPKSHVSLRLDADVVAKFKATGKGWQSRINEVLKAAKL